MRRRTKPAINFALQLEMYNSTLQFPSLVIHGKEIDTAGEEALYVRYGMQDESYPASARPMMTRQATNPAKLWQSPWHIVAIPQTNIIREIQFEGRSFRIIRLEGTSNRI